MKAFMAWSTDFQYHLAEWCYQDEWETGRKPNAMRRARLAVELLWFRYTSLGITCAVFGCDMVDDDPGNPEVGPQPCVYCQRCGR